MIDRLRSDCVRPSAEGVTAQVGPVQLALLCASRDRDRLAEQEGTADVVCELEFDLQQGALELLAFADEERRALYRALRAVSGVGRVTAFAVLDAGEVLDTLRAVAGADSNYFKNVSGLGAKRIASVCEELGRRYGHLPAAIEAPVAMLVDAREAMIAAGYSALEAENALLGLARDGKPVKSAEAWLELAVQSLQG